MLIYTYVDFGVCLIPIITSIYWIRSDTGSTGREIVENTQAISISCLLLDIKFLLFFRAFESFGVYFAIILGVAKRIKYFLFIILIIIFSFAHAFLILLGSKQNLSESDVNTNPSDPSDYPTFLLNTYLFLTGSIIN